MEDLRIRIMEVVKVSRSLDGEWQDELKAGCLLAEISLGVPREDS